MITRDDYLAQLIQWKDHALIKVVTGVRRCGKSTLFSLFADYLKTQGVRPEQIVSINLEDLAFESLCDYKALYRYVKERMRPDAKTYIFLDEVQQCPQFEKAVDSLFIQPNADVYITGSNAYMLSGELATLLSGRYVTIDMLPLSFREFASIPTHTPITQTEKFEQYLTFGSFPYVAQLTENESAVRTYLEGIYHTILLKDIASRESINDVTLLEQIIKTLVSSIGSPISANKIANTIISSGRKTSTNTVERYLRCLTESYFFYRADRYDIKGRDFLHSLPKYYLVDAGLRQLLVTNSASDVGHMIENVVYLELLRRGYRVLIGKLDTQEVDFVATMGNSMLYVQVSATVLDPTTLTRELAPLQKIQDNHPKLLLTLDIIGKNANYDGILQQNLVDWLCKEEFTRGV